MLTIIKYLNEHYGLIHKSNNEKEYSQQYK